MSTHSSDIDYDRLTRQELEDILNQPNLSQEQRGRVGNTLANRIQLELLNAAGINPSLHPLSSPNIVPKANDISVDSQPTSGNLTNTSYQEAKAVIPEEIKGWNWGAFLLPLFWSIGNSTWIGLLSLVPFVGFIVPFVLGSKGNEWAWHNNKWDSIEHFQRVQKNWEKWGFILLAIGVFFGCIIGFLAGAGGY